MDESVKVILKKLDEIDSRLRSIEGVKIPAIPKLSEVKEQKVPRDAFFGKALEIMDKYEELSSKQLQEALKIDQKRADAILDQLEIAGLGTCYMKEV